MGILTGSSARRWPPRFTARRHSPSALACPRNRRSGPSCPWIMRGHAAHPRYSAGFPVTPQLARVMQCSSRIVMLLTGGAGMLGLGLRRGLTGIIAALAGTLVAVPALAQDPTIDT